MQVTETLTFSDSLRKWEGCKIQLHESRVDYLSAKNFGNTTNLFTSAVILAEAFCSAEEAREAYEDVCAEDARAVHLAEESAADAEELRAAIQHELEVAS